MLLFFALVLLPREAIACRAEDAESLRSLCVTMRADLTAAADHCSPRSLIAPLTALCACCLQLALAMSTHLHLRPPTLPRRMRSAPANGTTAAAAASAAAAAAAGASPPLAAAAAATAAPARPLPRQSVPTIPRVLEGSSDSSSSSDSDDDDSEHHLLTDAGAMAAGLTNDAWFAAPTADEIAAAAAAQQQQQQQQQEASQLSRVSVALAEFNSTWFNELRPRAQHTQPAPPPLPPRRKRPEGGTAGTAAGSAAASASTTAQSTSSGAYALAVPGVASSPSPRPTPSPPQSNLSASLVGYEVLYADGTSSAALPPGVSAQYQAAKSKPKYTLYKILVTLGQPSRPSSARQSPNVSPRLSPSVPSSSAAYDQPDLESLDLGGGNATMRAGGAAAAGAAAAASSRPKARSQSMSATSSWFVYRRYSDFHTLHQSLLALSGLGGMRNIERNWLLFLPPKVRAPTCFATGVIEMRFSIFDSYVRNLCARPLLAELPEVQHFLGVNDEPLPPHIRGTKPDKNNLHRGKQLISSHLIAKMNGNEDMRFGGGGTGTGTGPGGMDATGRGVHRHSASSLNHSGGGSSAGGSGSFPLYSIPASSVLDFLSTGDLLLFRTNSTLSGLQRSLTHSNWDHIAMVVARPILSRNKSNLCLLESVNRGGIKCNPLEGALMEWRRKGLAKMEKHKRKLMSNHQIETGTASLSNEHPLMQDCSVNSLAAAKSPGLSSSASGSASGASSYSDRSPFPTISIRKLYNWAPSDELLLKLEAFVDSIVGNAYSLRGIFKLGRKMVKDMLVAGVGGGGGAAREKKEKKIKDTALQTAYFCSELIAACYRVAEILPMPPARGAAGAAAGTDAAAAAGHPPLAAGSSSPLFSPSASPNSGSGSGNSGVSYAHGHGLANPFLSKPISDFLPGDFSTEEVDVRLALDAILWETAGVKLGEEIRIDLQAEEEPTTGTTAFAAGSAAKQATSPASLSRENSTSAVHSSGDALHIDLPSEGTSGGTGGSDASLSVLGSTHADGDSPGALPPLPPSADSTAPSSAAPSPLARRARASRPGSISGAGASALGQPPSDDEHNQSGAEDDMMTHSGLRSHSPSNRSRTQSSQSTQSGRTYSDATEPPLPAGGGSATRSASGTPRLMESTSASRYSSGPLASGARAATPTVPATTAAAAAAAGSLAVPSVPTRRNSVPQPDHHSDRDVAIALGGRAIPAHHDALPPPILDSTPPIAAAAAAAPPTAAQQKSKSKISQLMGSSFISTHTDWNPNPAAASQVSPPKPNGFAVPSASTSASSPSLSALPPPSLSAGFGSATASATATPTPRVNINKGSRDKIKALMGESVIAPRGLHIPPPSPSQQVPESTNQQRRAKTTSGADSSHSIAAAAAVASAKHEPISPHASSLAVSIPLAGAPRPRVKQVKGSGDKLRELLGSSPAAVNAAKGAGYSRRISLSADAGDVFTAHKLAPLPSAAMGAGAAPTSAPALPEMDSPHSDDAAEFVAVGAAPSASLAFLPAAWTSPAAALAAAPVAPVAALPVAAAAAPVPTMTSSAPIAVPTRPPRPPSMSVSAILPPAGVFVSAWAKPAAADTSVSSSPRDSPATDTPSSSSSDPPSPPPPPPPPPPAGSALPFASTPPSSSLQLLDPRRDSTDSIPPSPPPMIDADAQERDRSTSSTLSDTIDAALPMTTAGVTATSPNVSLALAAEAGLEITDLEDA